MALAFAGAAALVASATNADAGAAEINSAWSHSFADSLPTNNGLELRRTPSLPGADWVLRCFVNCAPAFATYIVRRSELLTSNDADVSAKRVVDATGRAMGVSGMIVIERLEPDGFGAVVVGERTLDGNGAHSWSLLSSGISLDAPWLPGDLYQFEGSSFSIDFAAASPAGAGATPEPSTWAMILIGFAGLGLAGCRSSRNNQRSIHFPDGIYAR
jgi:PEP-CTERM motif